MLKVNFDAIIYIESFSDYIKIHLDTSTLLRKNQHDTLSKGKVIITRETISAIEAKLPKSKFLRIHRSYIISIAKIQSFTNEHITVNRLALSISRSYKKEVLKLLENF